jgi:large subunit ribosomal protein L5
MHPLKQHYQQTVVPALVNEFGIENAMAVPQIKKIVINTGISQPQDPRARRKICENVVEQLAVISGQKPQITTAKKSISGFKLREGDPLGVSVTLRGQFMWEFLQKLISVALPRVKDFRGVSATAFDAAANYSLGISEQIIFPEVNYDTIDSVRGFQVNMITSTTDTTQAYRLLELLGMPFVKKENNG